MSAPRIVTRETIQRAYSVLTVKSVDEETREISGIATTPEPDHYSDVVDPMGAEYELPLPMLSQHNSAKPVGHVITAKPSKTGIPVTTRIVRPGVDDPKSWSERLNEAWADVKHGLVRGFSIGFMPLEWTYMEDTGGYRFIRWRWLELSLVTIPANADATIQTIKSIDRQLRAASGLVRPAVKLIPAAKLPGVSGTQATASRGAVKLIPR